MDDMIDSRWSAARRQLSPAAGPRRRLPGGVVLSSVLWTALGLMTLWSGVDVFARSRPDSAGVNSGDLDPAAQTSTLSVADLVLMLVGVLMLLAVGMLVIGVPWSRYALYLMGAASDLTLAAGGHASAVAAIVLVCAAAAALQGRAAREFLGAAPAAELVSAPAAEPAGFDPAVDAAAPRVAATRPRPRPRPVGSQP